MKRRKQKNEAMKSMSKVQLELPLAQAEKAEKVEKVPTKKEPMPKASCINCGTGTLACEMLEQGHLYVCQECGTDWVGG